MRRLIPLLLLVIALGSALPAHATTLPTTTTTAAARDLAASGPFRAGWTDVTITAADGHVFGARIYYPARRNGANTPISLAGAPYPVISFAHGFIQPVSRYASTLRHLATWGFLVAAPWAEADLSPNPNQLAFDLSRAFSWLVAQNSTTGSRFAGAVDTEHFGVSGHSMGGGASIVAASRDPRVDAVANLAAVPTSIMTPPPTAAISQVLVPVQLIGGSEDIIIPPATSQVPLYANANGPRQAPLLLGGSHCGFLDHDDPIFCDTGSMSRTTQLSITRRMLTAWFLLYLKGDQALWPQVWGPGTFNDPQITLTADPGATLNPPTQSGNTPVGQPKRYTFTLTNTRPLSSAYQLEVVSQWPATSSLSQTPPLATNEATTLSVEITPVAAGTQQALLIARSLVDGGTVVLATLTTTAP